MDLFAFHLKIIHLSSLKCNWCSSVAIVTSPMAAEPGSVDCVPGRSSESSLATWLFEWS